MSITAMKLMVHELEYVLDCINKNKIPFDGDDFHEALRLGRQAVEQAEKNQFNPDWDAMSVMVEEQQSMAKRIEELEQAEKQEPVAWESILGAVARGWCYEENANKTMDSDLAVAIAKEVQALYTTPQPQREWIGLTDDEYKDLHLQMKSLYMYQDYGHAIEAKLKEKNT